MASILISVVNSSTLLTDMITASHELLEMLPGEVSTVSYGRAADKRR